MPRYIDAEELKATVKANDWSNPCVPIAVNMIIDRSPSADVVEVVRCKDCDVLHNRWTGCPNLNGLIPPPDFCCARGERKQKAADAADNNVGHKPSCCVCERITGANKDIFWTFARTHQFEHKEEFAQVPARFCPACGREIEKEKE